MSQRTKDITDLVLKIVIVVALIILVMGADSCDVMRNNTASFIATDDKSVVDEDESQAQEDGNTTGSTVNREESSGGGSSEDDESSEIVQDVERDSSQSSTYDYDASVIYVPGSDTVEINVPEGMTAVIEGYKVDGVDRGVYKFKEQSGSVSITDGAYVVVPDEYAEYVMCERLKIGKSHKWAQKNVPWREWESVCN